MAKTTGNKATEMKTAQTTSTAIALVIPEQTAVSKGTGLKIINTLYENYATEAQIVKLKSGVEYKNKEALATLTKVLYDAAATNKAIYMLFTGAFKSDRKVQAMANDTAKALLDMGHFTKNDKDEDIFALSKEVSNKFARDKKADTAEFKKGEYAYKNFHTQMKTAMQNAVGAIDLKFDEVEMDKDAGTLAISGPAAEKIWGSDVVVLNSASAEQNLPAEVDGKKTPEASMKTIRELAAKTHSDKPSAPQVTSKVGEQVTDGNIQSAVQKASAEFIALVNKLEGNPDADTVRSLISVANVIRPLLPELNPKPRATDSARAASAATQVVRGVTLATSAKPAGKSGDKVKKERATA